MVGSKKVGQCLNDNCFLGLDVYVALIGRPERHQTARAALNITKNETINKNNKILYI